MNLGAPVRKRINRPLSSSGFRCVVCGYESVGKTQLLASLTGRLPKPESFRGSTVACETYRDGKLSWTDTPGIVRESETFATRAAINEIDSADCVMLVVRADRAAEQLPSLLDATAGKPGIIALTFSDRVSTENMGQVEKLSATLGVPIIPIDARHLKADEAIAIRDAAKSSMISSSRFPDSAPDIEYSFPSFTNAQENSRLEKFVSIPLVAFVLLLLPAMTSVLYANRFADWVYSPLMEILKPALARIAAWPSLPAALFGGDYGLLAMFPFLLLYAFPTIIAFSVILAIFKSTGLIDHLSHALHPFLRPIGIGGRDLVRVVMGFGCNVPAIVSSRACHDCSRGACVSAISFGSACSYQLPATLAVFAAAGIIEMGFIYLGILTLTTLIYLRFTTPKVLRLKTNALVTSAKDSLAYPSWRYVWREICSTLKQFVVMAFPVFIVICLVAAFLDKMGVIGALSRALSPLLTLFNLPGDAASAIVLGSIRKDGIAIGLLESAGGSLKVALTTPTQVLTLVYMAGVLLPCLVTIFTIAREMRWKFAIKLCTRQMLWAAGFSFCIAWIGELAF